MSGKLNRYTADKAIRHLTGMSRMKQLVHQLKCENYKLKARIKELEKETHEQSMNFEGLLTLLDDSKNRIDELESTQPKWISVKDRLPEKEDADNDLNVLAHCVSYGGFFQLVKIGIFNYTIRKDYDYWMPLPPPPKEESTATDKEDK